MAIALAILSPSLVGLPIADHGTEALQKQSLAGLTEGSFKPGSLAIVEPRFDFDVYHPHTTAKADGAEFVLDGVKCQVPWLEGGDQVVVIAAEGGQLAAFALPRDAAGLSAAPELKMGLCGLPTVELTLAGGRVPADARLDAGDAEIRNLIDRGRLALAAAAIGTARAAFEVSRDYAKERETFGQPIATRQAIAFKLADMAIEIDGARLLIWEAAAALDRGEDANRLVRLAHDQTTRITLEVADGAVQVYGGHGYIRDYLPELHLRNVTGLSSFEALALV
jgi:alkylation response protein AidB-like acyl-CoA dehydrogenase